MPEFLYGIVPSLLVASAVAPSGEAMIDEGNHTAPQNASGDGLKEGVHYILCVLTGGFIAFASFWHGWWVRGLTKR